MIWLSKDHAALPHDLCIAHGLVDARESAHCLLHHLLTHAEHVVLLKELIRQLCHTQAWVNLLHSHIHKELANDKLRAWVTADDFRASSISLCYTMEACV